MADLPRSTPPSMLDRLRADLAGPRGTKRIDALLSEDDAAAAIAELPAPEMYRLVHEVGFADALQLIELATPEQIQTCVDLDGWDKDTLVIPGVAPWLAAVMEAGPDKLGEVWRGLDAELRALIVLRNAVVFDLTLGEGPEEDDEGEMFSTPDGAFVVKLTGSEDENRLTAQLIDFLYRSDMALARHTLMAARSEPAAELEEMSLRWRSGRLADHGYADFYEALELFRPLPLDQIHVGEGTEDRLDVAGERNLPAVVAEEVLGRSFLARALDKLGATATPDELQRIDSAILVLVNKVLAAGRAKPGDEQVLRRGALYATATASLGLEAIARGDLERAAEGLRTISLTKLFRAGYTQTLRIAKLAQALAPRAALAGTPAVETVAALCSPRPLFAREADDEPAAGVRPFDSVADVKRAADVLTELLLRVGLVEGFGIDLRAMAQLPEPRPDLDAFARTALVRRMIGGSLTPAPLTLAEVRSARATIFADGVITPAARERAHAAVLEQVSAKQPGVAAPVVSALVDRWLLEIAEMIGGVTEDDLDPRFATGLLLQVGRAAQS